MSDFVSKEPLTLKGLVDELRKIRTSPFDLAKDIVGTLKRRNVSINARDLCGCIIKHADFRLNKQEMSDILRRLEYSEDEIHMACLFVEPMQVTVNARLSWQNTGIYIPPLAKIEISYLAGVWKALPWQRMVGPEGHRNTRANSGYALPGTAEGALIAKVGDYIFPTGRSFQGYIPKEGILEFVINDDIDGIYGAGLRDNKGMLEMGIQFVA